MRSTEALGWEMRRVRTILSTPRTTMSAGSSMPFYQTAPWQAPQIRLRLLGAMELYNLQRKALGVDVHLA